MSSSYIIKVQKWHTTCRDREPFLLEVPRIPVVGDILPNAGTVKKVVLSNPAYVETHTGFTGDPNPDRG